jgi:Tfp pilus assembly protein PilF
VENDFARDDCITALRATRNDADLSFGVGRIYEEKRKPELAVEHYQKALSLEKDPARKMRIINFMDKLFG